MVTEGKFSAGHWDTGQINTRTVYRLMVIDKPIHNPNEYEICECLLLLTELVMQNGKQVLSRPPSARNY